MSQGLCVGQATVLTLEIELGSLVGGDVDGLQEQVTWAARCGAQDRSGEADPYGCGIRVRDAALGVEAERLGRQDGVVVALRGGAILRVGKVAETAAGQLRGRPAEQRLQCAVDSTMERSSPVTAIPIAEAVKAPWTNGEGSLSGSTRRASPPTARFLTQVTIPAATGRSEIWMDARQGGGDRVRMSWSYGRWPAASSAALNGST